MIALLGEKDIFNFFIPFGIKVYEVENKNDLLSYISEIKKNNYKILILSNFCASLIEKDLEKLYINNDSFKIFILPPIKDEKDNKFLYKNYMKYIVEKAIGIDLLNK